MGEEEVYHVATSGGYAYAGAWQGFCVIDIRDPQNPAFVSRVANLVFWLGVSVSGNEEIPLDVEVAS